MTNLWTSIIVFDALIYRHAGSGYNGNLRLILLSWVSKSLCDPWDFHRVLREWILFTVQLNFGVPFENRCRISIKKEILADSGTEGHRGVFSPQQFAQHSSKWPTRRFGAGLPKRAPSFSAISYSWTTMLQSVKIKLVRKPRMNDKERQNPALSTAISGLQTALQLVKGIAGNVGIGPPGLQAGLTGLLFVLNAIQVTINRTA